MFKILISEDDLTKFTELKSCIESHLNSIGLKFLIHHEKNVNGTINHLINNDYHITTKSP